MSRAESVAHSAYSQGAVNHVPFPWLESFSSSSLYTFTKGSPSSGTALQDNDEAIKHRVDVAHGYYALQRPIPAHLILQLA